MTISLRAAGTATSATAAVTAINPSVPTGTTTGDISVLSVWMKPYNTTITTPSGWTKIGEATNGTTASGTDTGSTKIAVFIKESASVGAIGNITFSGANSCGAVINSYQHGANLGWDTSSYTTGGDTTNGANYSATGAAGIAVAAGDWVCQSTAVNGDVGTQSAQAIGGMSGATLGTYVSRQSADVTTGNDSHGEIGDIPVSSGSSSSAPTFTYTNSSSGSGTTLWLRLREFPKVNASATTATGTAEAYDIKFPTKANAGTAGRFDRFVSSGVENASSITSGAGASVSTHVFKDRIFALGTHVHYNGFYSPSWGGMAYSPVLTGDPQTMPLTLAKTCKEWNDESSTSSAVFAAANDGTTLLVAGAYDSSYTNSNAGYTTDPYSDLPTYTNITIGGSTTSVNRLFYAESTWVAFCSEGGYKKVYTATTPGGTWTARTLPDDISAGSGSWGYDEVGGTWWITGWGNTAADNGHTTSSDGITWSSFNISVYPNYVMNAYLVNGVFYVYAESALDFGRYGIWSSSDNGSTWVYNDANIPQDDPSEFYSGVYYNYGYWWAHSAAYPNFRTVIGQSANGPWEEIGISPLGSSYVQRQVPYKGAWYHIHNTGSATSLFVEISKSLDVRAFDAAPVTGIHTRASAGCATVAAAPSGPSLATTSNPNAQIAMVTTARNIAPGVTPFSTLVFPGTAYVRPPWAAAGGSASTTTVISGLPDPGNTKEWPGVDLVGCDPWVEWVPEAGVWFVPSLSGETTANYFTMTTLDGVPVAHSIRQENPLYGADAANVWRRGEFFIARDGVNLWTCHVSNIRHGGWVNSGPDASATTSGPYQRVEGKASYPYGAPIYLSYNYTYIEWATSPDQGWTAVTSNSKSVADIANFQDRWLLVGSDGASQTTDPKGTWSSISTSAGACCAVSDSGLWIKIDYAGAVSYSYAGEGSISWSTGTALPAEIDVGYGSRLWFIDGIWWLWATGYSAAGVWMSQNPTTGPWSKVSALNGADQPSLQTIDGVPTLVSVVSQNNHFPITATLVPLVQAPIGPLSGAQGIGTRVAEVSTANSDAFKVSAMAGLATRDRAEVWSAITSVFGSSAVIDVAYGDGIWVAVGVSGKLATATDPAGTWTLRTSGFGSTTIQGVAYAPKDAYGNGMWVTVGGTKTIGYAEDPTGTWTIKTTNVYRPHVYTRVTYARKTFWATGTYYSGGYYYRSLYGVTKAGLAAASPVGSERYEGQNYGSNLVFYNVQSDGRSLICTGNAYHLVFDLGDESVNPGPIESGFGVAATPVAGGENLASLTLSSRGDGAIVFYSGVQRGWASSGFPKGDWAAVELPAAGQTTGEMQSAQEVSVVGSASAQVLVNRGDVTMGSDWRTVATTSSGGSAPTAVAYGNNQFVFGGDVGTMGWSWDAVAAAFDAKITAGTNSSAYPECAAVACAPVDVAFLSKAFIGWGIPL